ncbi:DUF2499 domain-containing protein [Heliorestis acidaminivorans]|uniref:DUF2499 domain-containing protein n=1 Tax=Heliorestis acidaminivorans TaxID=553427 RepID=UPI001478D0CA|nr:DUF2499 domain-containing protein [Heliorestis acidaminivorans]
MFDHLSLPTWIVHFASLIEWGIAMLFFYMIGKKSDNIWFRRMPLAMIPYLLSGFFAIFYHLTHDTVQWLSDIQGYLTFLGSLCFALWGYLYLRSLTGRYVKRGGMTYRA